MCPPPRYALTRPVLARINKLVRHFSRRQGFGCSTRVRCG